MGFLTTSSREASPPPRSLLLVNSAGGRRPQTSSMNLAGGHRPLEKNPGPLKDPSGPPSKICLQQSNKICMFNAPPGLPYRGFAPRTLPGTPGKPGFVKSRICNSKHNEFKHVTPQLITAFLAQPIYNILEAQRNQLIIYLPMAEYNVFLTLTGMSPGHWAF